MSLINRLTEIASQQPENTALADIHNQISWQEMIFAVEHLAERLKVYQGQVVALHADNSAPWVVVDLACMKAGIIILPLPSFFSKQQIDHSLRASGVFAVITDRAELFDESKKNTEKLILQLNIVHIHESSDEVSIPAKTSKITFTSGSTGQPKGVCLSVENQYRVALSLTQRVDLKAPIHLCVLPLSTLLENVAGVYAPLLAGGQVRFLPAIKMGFNGGKGFCSEKFIAAISQQQPNSLIVLPELLLALLDAVSKGWHIPESLQFIAVGGSRVSPDLLIQARELGLPVYEGYGLSECGSVVSLNSFKANRPGTVGKVLPHLNVQLVDGQVVVTGNTFLGYLNHPDSWYKNQVHTGDLAEWDTEGYLHIRGRIKNLLISSFGRNINPEWLESEVMANPMIHHCVVLGDAKPYCSALIQKRNAAVTDADVQQWIDCINLKLPDYAQICQWQKFSEPLTVQAGTLTENGRPVRSMIDLSFKYQISDIYKEVS